MPREKDLEKYQKIIDFINSYWEQNGVSPTTRQIAEGTGIARATTGWYLQDMRDKGMVVYDGRRDFRVGSKTQGSPGGVANLPLVGDVSCGPPNLAEQNIEDYIPVSRKLIGNGDFYLLRASGDSMTGAGIDNGDIVLIRQQPTAEYGQIVVAKVGNDEATLKRYMPDLENHRVILHPENDELADIIVDLTDTDFSIQGVARYVFKELL